MKSDATRDTFDATKHLSRVIMQQGRVALDADHNEQVAIFWHYLAALAEDVVGAHAAPADGGGFELGVDAKGALTITAGRYYVAGLLVENSVDYCTYASQPSYPPAAGDPLVNAAKDPVTLFVYLDVWEQHVTWIEDPSIREVALGGPDTCTRARLIWQVKVAPFVANADHPDPDCSFALDGLVGLGAARLAARVDPGATSHDPCVMAPESKYRGAENQLYRVEVHAPGGAGTATMKWSRDNGSVLTKLDTIAGNDLEVTSTRGFEAGDWVELTNDAIDLRGEPGTLVRVASVQAGALSLDADRPALDDFADAALHPKVRRWNQASSQKVLLSHGAVPITESTAADPGWMDLEDGVQVRFEAGGDYRTGDHWLIPARVATGRLEWPSTVGAGGKPEGDLREPHGIRHHFAPLGFVSAVAGRLVLKTNCRSTFLPLSHVGGL